MFETLGTTFKYNNLYFTTKCSYFKYNLCQKIKYIIYTLERVADKVSQILKYSTGQLEWVSIASGLFYLTLSRFLHTELKMLSRVDYQKNWFDTKKINFMILHLQTCKLKFKVIKLPAWSSISLK